MRSKKLTLARKLRILEHARSTNNIRATARLFKVQPSQIRRWRANMANIEVAAKENPKVQTLHKGRKPKNSTLEENVLNWVLETRAQDTCVTTTDIICKATSLCPEFMQADTKKLHSWVYRFMTRHNLSVRTATRIGQKLASDMEAVQRDFSIRIMMQYFSIVNNAKYFVNMDETNVYFNCKPKRTVNLKGQKTISIRIGSSTSLRVTVCVSIAMDGTKLPLFLIFKGMPRKQIERSLEHILPVGMHGCAQRKAWMDDRGMQIWYEKIWRPYLENYNGNSMLLLDDFKCHKKESFVEKLEELNTKRCEVPPGYTPVLQPCDVGINKVLKEKLRNRAHRWRSQQAALVPPGEAIPAPSRTNIANWLQEIWTEIPVEIVRNAFKGCGYVYANGENSTYDTESESESSSDEEYADLPSASEDDLTDDEV